MLKLIIIKYLKVLDFGSTEYHNDIPVFLPRKLVTYFRNWK